jgi:hypothetical protein
MIRETVQGRVEREKAKPIDPMSFVGDDFMTNQQIAAQYAISDDTVLNAQNDGELIYCVFGRAYSSRPARRSPKRAVHEWAASRFVARRP